MRKLVTVKCCKAEKTIESQSRLENIDEFLSVTKAFEEAVRINHWLAF